MLEVSSTEAASQFHQLLHRVERGETVRIRKHGKIAARMVPDADWMTGKAFAKVFADYQATDLDKAAADAIADNIAQIGRGN